MPKALRWFQPLVAIGGGAAGLQHLHAVALAGGEDHSLGITYAMWSGIGIVAIVLVGVLAYRQTPTAMQLFGMALIAAGVVTVNVSGPGHG